MREVLAGLLLVAACTPGDVPVGDDGSTERGPRPEAWPDGVTLDRDVGMRCRIRSTSRRGEVVDTRLALTSDGHILGEVMPRQATAWFRWRDGTGRILHVSVLTKTRAGTSRSEERYEDGRIVASGYDTWTWDDAGRLVDSTNPGDTWHTWWTWDDDDHVTSQTSEGMFCPCELTWRWTDGRLAYFRDYGYDSSSEVTWSSWDAGTGLPTAGVHQDNPWGEPDRTADETWSWTADGEPLEHRLVYDDGVEPDTTWTYTERADGGLDVQRVADVNGDGTVDRTDSWVVDAGGHIVEDPDGYTYSWSSDGRLTGAVFGDTTYELDGDCPGRVTRGLEPRDWRESPLPDMSGLQDPTDSWL